MKKKIDNIINALMCIFLLIMVALVFYNAILRYIFNTTMVTSEELARFCFVWMSFLGIVMAYRAGDHVSVTILTNVLKGRWKLAFEIIRDLCVFGIMAFTFVGGVQYTILCNYASVATGINLMLIVSSVPIAAGAILGFWAVEVFERYFHKKQHKEG